ncbi:Crp/Fnr family transcriptional regulator [Methylobacterium dankookense]|uniref:Cyclic nucleotide-binding domain-containing protein n=1 Tax=Methylobacterium dankookense TaxID=560405 RepID=A0A564FTQ3_9HYPH|nr:Crp/Fnr family transcriptional regulator [Methylobacterium dankookense]GJD57236.1 hypothetical protein IFDJLNFL_3137 [Methylobacterium dankookense]VUF11525.1 hypothetical protein MTDSW087_01207 [Methylobacterium dankookense]
MGLDDDIAILAAAPLLRFFGQDALRLITFASERRALAADEVLFRQGDPADGAFVVMAGTVRLMPRAAGAEPVTAGRSALIGQLALFTGGERPCEARAAEAADVMRVTPILVRRLMAEFPEAATAIHDALAEDLAVLSADLARLEAQFSGVSGP